MPTISEEESRLEGLIQANTNHHPLQSEEELRLISLGEAIHNPLDPGGVTGVAPNGSSGTVSEDFVELSVPGYSGLSSVGGRSQGLDAVSPMLSMASVTSVGVSRGGGFGRSNGSKFSVVVVVRDPRVCFSDIGDGGKFCLKVNCSTAAHRGAKKFDPTDDGSVVIARSRDVAFASPSLGGSVLPQTVLQDWQQSSKTLEEWNPLFKASQRDSSFGSAAEHEARLREQQLSESYRTPACLLYTSPSPRD